MACVAVPVAEEPAEAVLDHEEEEDGGAEPQIDQDVEGLVRAQEHARHPRQQEDGEEEDGDYAEYVHKSGPDGGKPCEAIVTEMEGGGSVGPLLLFWRETGVRLGFGRAGSIDSKRGENLRS